MNERETNPHWQHLCVKPTVVLIMSIVASISIKTCRLLNLDLQD